MITGVCENRNNSVFPPAAVEGKKRCILSKCAFWFLSFLSSEAKKMIYNLAV